MAHVVLAHSHYDQGHLAAVASEMETLGSPRIRVIDGGGIYYAIEGCHRLRAAAAHGIPVHLEILGEDESIDLTSLDLDTMKWFDDETLIPFAEFVGWFVDHYGPADLSAEIVQVERA